MIEKLVPDPKPDISIISANRYIGFIDRLAEDVTGKTEKKTNEQTNKRMNEQTNKQTNKCNRKLDEREGE